MQPNKRIDVIRFSFKTTLKSILIILTEFNYFTFFLNLFHVHKKISLANGL